MAKSNEQPIGNPNPFHYGVIRVIGKRSLADDQADKRTGITFLHLYIATGPKTVDNKPASPYGQGLISLDCGIDNGVFESKGRNLRMVSGTIRPFKIGIQKPNPDRNDTNRKYVTDMEYIGNSNDGFNNGSGSDDPVVEWLTDTINANVGSIIITTAPASSARNSTPAYSGRVEEEMEVEEAV
jgi:hypothetical protein